jgi:UDP-perosamine 4-acetyltransferase
MNLSTAASTSKLHEPPLRRIALMGAGGHARVILDTLATCGGWKVEGFVAKDPTSWNTRVNGFPVLGDDSLLPELRARGVVYAFVAFGSHRVNPHRGAAYSLLQRFGFEVPNVIAPSATLSGSAKFGRGNAILAHAVVGAGACLGHNIIVNTGAIVEHDCWIEDHVHIASSACLAGRVRVGECSHLGLGCRVRQDITIGRNVLVGAGAVVVHDLPDDVEAWGVPARVMRPRPRNVSGEMK